MTNAAIDELKKLASEVTKRNKTVMHAWICAEVIGKTAVICLSALAGKGVVKEVVGNPEHQLSTDQRIEFVRSVNKAMNATHNVVSMLVELYKSQNQGDDPGVNIRY